MSNPEKMTPIMMIGGIDLNGTIIYEGMYMQSLAISKP